jgi:hypothetical protein
MMQRVVETFQPQETVLINYSKSDRPFTNHLTVGHVYLKKQIFAKKSCNSWWASWKKSLEKVTAVSVVLQHEWMCYYAGKELVGRERRWFESEREEREGKYRFLILYTATLLFILPIHVSI